MRLTLQREHSTAAGTFGVLFVDGRFQCHTLEDVVRVGPKVAGQTAIPAGVYPVTITHSPRFNRRLPLVEGVPGFIGIRFHVGNTASDTEGCILPGTGRNALGVTQSTLAFFELFKVLDKATTPIVLSVVSASSTFGDIAA